MRRLRSWERPDAGSHEELLAKKGCYYELVQKKGYYYRLYTAQLDDAIKKLEIEHTF